MPNERHFACTMCGKCCNRSPEVELAETLDLSSDFVFWLCFSVSELPLSIKDWQREFGKRVPTQRDLAIFNARRRSLEQRSAIRFTSRSDVRHENKRVRKYIRISALAFDLEPGRCDKLINRECSLYNRRPHTCKTVPMSYHLPELELEHELDKFTGMEGFECDTSTSAEAVLQDSRIVSNRFALDRAAAQAKALKDESWHNEIAKRIAQRSDQTGELPSLDEIKESSPWKVLLVPIDVAWQVGREIGIIDEICYRHALESQTSLIETISKRSVGGYSLGINVKSRLQLEGLLTRYSSKRENSRI